MPTSDNSNPVGPEEFRKLLAPTVQAIRDLTEAISACVARHGDIPAANSQAMREVAAEVRYEATCPGWGGPMRDAHTFAGVSLGAANDLARSFAELFDTGITPMYGHLVIARSVLESSVVSHWLSDPSISYDARVKRALAEAIYSANELKRLGIEAGTTATDRLQKWLDNAAALSWVVEWPNGKFRGKPVVAGETRPGVPGGINKLLLVDGEWTLGRSQWCYLSAVSHATFWGLAQAVQQPPQDSIVATAKAGFGTSSNGVFNQAVCVIGAVRKAMLTRCQLMGWVDGDNDIRSALLAAGEHMQTLIQAFPVNEPPAEVDGSEDEDEP